MDNNFFMDEAYKLALKAYKMGEVPVGAVVVYNNKIIGRGFNCKEISKNVVNHAEIIAIEDACRYMNNWRLDNCSIFITLEPCMMCCGAIVESRISNVFYGTNSSEQMSFYYFHDHNVVVENLNNVNCSLILSKFFEKKR